MRHPYDSWMHQLFRPSVGVGEPSVHTWSSGMSRSLHALMLHLFLPPLNSHRARVRASRMLQISVLPEPCPDGSVAFTTTTVLGALSGDMPSAAARCICTASWRTTHLPLVLMLGLKKNVLEDEDMVLQVARAVCMLAPWERAALGTDSHSCMAAVPAVPVGTATEAATSTLTDAQRAEMLKGYTSSVRAAPARAAPARA
ncbi:hypothetical protein EON66_11345 [archaeon]|nr:MAG: hypothetical protein EON66_11345 [archaeon]